MVVVSYLVHEALLQNATDIITKCHRYFITKYDKSLLQNTSAFLLFKMRQLLQNVTFITKCVSTYYERPLHQIEYIV